MRHSRRLVGSQIRDRDSAAVPKFKRIALLKMSKLCDPVTHTEPEKAEAAVVTNGFIKYQFRARNETDHHVGFGNKSEAAGSRFRKIGRRLSPILAGGTVPRLDIETLLSESSWWRRYPCAQRPSRSLRFYENLERVGLGCRAECVIGIDNLVEFETMRD